MCIRDRTSMKKKPDAPLRRRRRPVETIPGAGRRPVSYTHLRAHETPEHLVCRLLLEKNNERAGKLADATASGLMALRPPLIVFFLMIRRPPRSTLDRSSAASDVYKRQVETIAGAGRR